MKISLSTEFFHSKSLPIEDFETAFKGRFPDGKIETVVEDVPGYPGLRFVNVVTFFHEKQEQESAQEELKRWWAEYVDSRGFAPKFGPRTTYPSGDE